METALATSVAIYLRLIDYKKSALTSNGTLDSNIANTSMFDAANPQFIKVSSYSSNVEQTLTIGSQSSGVGAGKIAFNPLQITKYLDAVSPILFQKAAVGTPYQTAEIFFVNAQNAVAVKHVYKLVAVKTISWSADSGSGVIENVTFDYGGQVIVVNKLGPDGKATDVVKMGWNKVRNIADNDPDAIIDMK